MTLNNANLFDYTWIGLITPQIVDLKRKLFLYKGFYVVLEEYNDISDIIEKTKYLFSIPTRRYNICKYKYKYYFMFECFPFNENDFSFCKKTNFQLEVQIVGLFHWVMGIKGKFSEFNDGFYSKVTSKGPYKVDFKNTDLTKIDIDRLIPNINVKVALGLHFNDEYKKDVLFDLINDKYRNWYLQIIKRINEL
jgi:hypothetical protein